MSFSFGNIQLENNIFLAPMAGVTDLAFRTICHKHGCALSYTEMVSAKALCHNSQKTENMMETLSFPSAVQVFGHDPEVLGQVSQKVSEKGLFVDINMGCPAPKIVNNNDGSALMKNLPLARSIVGSVVKNSILFEDTVIGNSAELNCVITDKNTTVRDNRILSGHENIPFYIDKGKMI